MKFVRNPTLVILTVLSASSVFGQRTVDGCALQASDFVTTELFNKSGTSGAASDATLSEPTRMDVQVVSSGNTISHVNVFFVQRLGQVKMFDGAQKKVVALGAIEVHAKQGSQDDNGLMGIALDPRFTQNRWVYFWYSPAQMDGQNRILRLTRMTLNADYTLNKGSEKILIQIRGSTSDQWHSGGPLQFDSYGDLWVAIGNNSPDLDPGACNVMSTSNETASAEWGPSSTANMRGGFIRIHPDDTAPKGYTIPRGNFGEYWADQFEKQGNATLAAQYRDTAKVLPEIYVKGERSNYSISVHPTKRWLAWGTVNFSTFNDEFNIAKNPIFSGFPYFHANNAKTCNNLTMDPAKPENNSPFNKGVKQLPPAMPGTINNLVNVAIGGPIYVFDPALNLQDPATGKPVKFPLHFNDTWLLSGFEANKIWVANLDTSNNGLKVLGTPTSREGGLIPRPRNHVQSMYGADGALYILNYDGHYNVSRNPGVMRVTYKGCGATVAIGNPQPRPEPYQKVWLLSGRLKVGETGPHTVSLHGLDGALLHRVQAGDAADYSIRDWQDRLGLDQGVYLVRVQTTRGAFTRSVSLP